MKFATPLAAGLAVGGWISEGLGSCWAQTSRHRRSPDRFGQFSKVECGGGQEEFVAGAGHASEAEPLQPDDPFHVGEGDLDFLAILG